MSRLNNLSGILLLLVIYIPKYITCQDNLVSVLTTHGEVVGKQTIVKVRTGDSITDIPMQMFLGIPYAKPPTGDRRFRYPEETEGWVGKKMTMEESKGCVQVTPRIMGSVGLSDADMSEDCLYLNVLVPLPIESDVAVMVSIHGGGFIAGSTKIYNWATLAATEGVIVVSMNYRVNTLGLLYLGTDDCPGNMAIKDQELALKWVQDNIDRFGGNPKRVTIFGQSAGSVSTALHILNPSSSHLFQRAILQSGTPNSFWASDTKLKAYEKSKALAIRVGCGKNLSNETGTINCLRKVDAKALVNASDIMGDSLSLFHVPVVDNKMVFSDIQKGLQGLKTKQILMGFTNDDGALMARGLMNYQGIAAENIFQACAEEFLGNVSETALKSLRYFYKDHCHSKRDNIEDIMAKDLTTDSWFRCPIYDMADDIVKSGANTYLYQWMYRPQTADYPSWVNADHGAEMGIMLSTASIRASLEETRLARRLLDYWGNFAKYGNPNKGKTGAFNWPINANETRDEWPEYTLSQKERLDIDINISLKLQGRVHNVQCLFLKRFLPMI